MKGREHSIVLVIVTIICAVLIAVVFVEEPTDDLYYIGPSTDGHGHMFIQPSSEYENVIYVSLSDLNDWNISVSDVSIGDKFDAVFTDRTLWELESIKQE